MDECRPAHYETLFCDFGGYLTSPPLQRFPISRSANTRRMLQSLKVICKPPEFGALSFGKFRAMSSKQSSSPPPNGNAVKVSSNGNGNLGDDTKKIEKMTVQQLRSKLRDVGVPAKGSKDELISALRSFLDLNTGMTLYLKEQMHATVNVAIFQVSETIGYSCQYYFLYPACLVGPPFMLSSFHLLFLSFLPGIICECTTLLEDAEMENLVKRSSKRTSRKDHLLKESTIEASGTKRGKKATENSDEQLTASSTYRKVEMSVESLQMEDNRVGNKVQDKVSIKAKRKVRLKNDSLSVGTTDIVDLSVNQNEPWTVFAHKKPQEGWIAYNPRCMRRPLLNEDSKQMKLVSWNVNGLRALLKLDTFHKLAQREKFDVLCLQETKLQERDVEAIKQSLLEGYQYSYWTCSISKLGYSGTAVISRIKPVSVRYGLGISDHDSEGRLVTVEYDDFFLLNGYVPNSGDGLRRLSYRITQWDPSLGNYMKELEKSKPVILTGDLNCAHEEIDIYNPAGNKRSAGFTIEERQSFEANFLNKGFVDTFRRQHPGVVGYTYWGYRHGGRKTNRGWRLDYFLVSESLVNNVHDSYIVPDITGSDHCPIGIVLKL